MLQLPEHFISDLVALFGFAVIGITTLIIGYWVFDKLTPKIDFQDQLNKGNIAVAITMGSFFIALAWMIASVAHAIIGS